jgi:cytochrome c-type biogenesis protein CcmH
MRIAAIRSACAVIFAVLAMLGTAPAFAVQPDELMSDPALEARARELSAGLRCLVCQNQSIDDSDAPLARDLRLLVRERLQAGDTNEQVRDFVVERYGEFVLLKPPFSARTVVLWLAPFLVFAGAIFMVWRGIVAARVRRAVHVEAEPLTPEEQAKLDAVLAKGKAG